MARRGLIALTIVAVLIVASMAAAVVYLNGGTAKDQDRTTGQSITVTDDRGKNVTLPANPQRIVSLGSAFTEIIFDLNCSGKVVAADTSSMWLAEGANRSIADMGVVSSLGVESILAQNPDCVVIWDFGMYQTFISNMEAAHIPVLAFYPKNVTGILHTITVLGTAIGEKDNATSMVANMQQRIDSIVSQTSSISEDQKPKVYLELRNGQTVGNGTMSDELITMAGGVNIFHNGTGNWQASPESIIAQNPDVIIIEDQSAKTNAELASTLGPSVTAVAAYQNDQDEGIYRINGSTLTTSPSVVEALENMAHWLHPELFP